MSNVLTIIRSLVIYGLCVPLAIYLGYLLATPMDTVSFTIVLVAALLPLLPILLRWHHLLVFACWNTSVVLFFLKGSPNLWIIMAAVSLLLSVLQHILNPSIRFIRVPSVTRPLVFLAIVIVVTAELTGGFGMRSMGGESIGGKRYIFLFAAIIGYFAMTSYRVPEGRAPTYIALFYLGALTSIVGSLGPYFIGRSFYSIFLLFPVDSLAALYGEGPTEGLGLRLGGLTVAGQAFVLFLLARHGVRGLFDFTERLELSAHSNSRWLRVQPTLASFGSYLEVYG